MRREEKKCEEKGRDKREEIIGKRKRKERGRDLNKNIIHTDKYFE